MYVKIHKTPEREVLAVCDEDLIGKVFEEDDLQLKVSERFYKGEKLSEEKTLELLKKFTDCNLVGEKTIALAIKNNIISKDNIIKIQGVPHATISLI